MAIIYLRSRSHVKASMMLKRANHLFFTKLHKIIFKYYSITYINIPTGFTLLFNLTLKYFSKLFFK